MKYDWPPHGSTAFGKYGFFDCGAFGLFTLTEERFQPTAYGKRVHSSEKFFRERQSRSVDPSSFRVWNELAPYLKSLGESVTILDVGGYIGTFCIPLALAATAEGMSVKIHSFEPGPTRELLAINIQINGLSDIITMHDAAMSSFDGHTIYRFSTGGSIGGAVFGDPKEDQLQRVAPCLTVNRFCRDIEGPLFIKLDTQGFEPDIMMQAKDVIASKRAIWQIEFIAWAARKDVGGLSFADYLLSEFHCIESGREVTSEIMPSFLDEIDARKTRMADLLLIPRDSRYASVPFTRTPEAQPAETVAEADSQDGV